MQTLKANKRLNQNLCVRICIFPRFFCVCFRTMVQFPQKTLFAWVWLQTRICVCEKSLHRTKFLKTSRTRSVNIYRAQSERKQSIFYFYSCEESFWNLKGKKIAFCCGHSSLTAARTC